VPAPLWFSAACQRGVSFHFRWQETLFKLVKSLTAPLAFGSTDVDLITGTESFPNVTSPRHSPANPDDPKSVS